MPKHKKSTSLEREVIIAVTMLLMIMMGSVLAIHFLQPDRQQTTTSSSSPSHSDMVAPQPAPER